MILVFNDLNGYQHTISCERLVVEDQIYIGYTVYSTTNVFDITGNYNIQVRDKIFLNGSSEVFTLNRSDELVKIGDIAL
ncbi:TPA: hypothetical protein ACXI2C_003379 [Acinetobacter baumannii]|uniref:hypothetical protein n=1 Tax=Acinetobacter baumannii TaxID=470 RepID=UPI0007072958|nr:hypothetical protein [Acinetobacter baumannii]KQG93446.1 hypothetical protein APC57_15665 [Acinetobacter baumannii]